MKGFLLSLSLLLLPTMAWCETLYLVKEAKPGFAILRPSRVEGKLQIEGLEGPSQGLSEGDLLQVTEGGQADLSDLAENRIQLGSNAMMLALSWKKNENQGKLILQYGKALLQAKTGLVLISGESLIHLGPDSKLWLAESGFSTAALLLEGTAIIEDGNGDQEELEPNELALVTTEIHLAGLKEPYLSGDASDLMSPPLWRSTSPSLLDRAKLEGVKLPSMEKLAKEKAQSQDESHGILAHALFLPPEDYGAIPEGFVKVNDQQDFLRLKQEDLKVREPQTVINVLLDFER